MPTPINCRATACWQTTCVAVAEVTFRYGPAAMGL